MLLKVRISSNVTDLHPEHVPSTFVFDKVKLRLYLDLKDGSRKPVTDPLGLYIEETGGYIVIKDHSGTTVSNLKLSKLQTEEITLTAVPKLDIPADRYAVFDAEGKLCYRTAEELKSDLAIADIVIDTTHVDVVKDIQAGQLPELSNTVEDELWSIEFNAGTQTTATVESVVKSVNAHRA